MKKILFFIAITSYISVHSSNASAMPGQHGRGTGKSSRITGQKEYQQLPGSLESSYARVPAQPARSKITELQTSSLGLPPEQKSDLIERGISSIWQLNPSVDNLPLALHQTRTELCELRRVNFTLQEQIRGLQEKLDKDQASLAKFRCLYGELQRENDSNINTIADLQEQNSSIADLRQQNSQLLAQISSLRAEYLSFQAYVVQLVRQNTEEKRLLQDQLSRSGQENATTMSELEKLRRQFDLLRQKNGVVCQRNHVLEERMVAASNDHLSTMELVSSLRSQIATLESQLGTLGEKKA